MNRNLLFILYIVYCSVNLFRGLPGRLGRDPMVDFKPRGELEHIALKKNIWKILLMSSIMTVFQTKWLNEDNGWLESVTAYKIVLHRTNTGGKPRAC